MKDNKPIKSFVLYLLIAVLVSCSGNEFTEDSFISHEMPNSVQDSIRSVSEALNLVMNYSSDHNTRGSSPRLIASVDVLKRSDLKFGKVKMQSIETTDVLRDDTLLYSIATGNKCYIISRNKEAEPVLAIFDKDNFTFREFLEENPECNPLSSFLEMAIVYNDNPSFFSADSSITAKAITSNRFVIEAVEPKVKVAWCQRHPFNMYCPSNSLAGCVSIAAAQGFMVTQHVGVFNNLVLDYPKMEQFIDSTYYASDASTGRLIAKFIHQIGVAIGAKYDNKKGSADIKNGAKLFYDFGCKYSKDKKKIRDILKDKDRSFIMIGSFNKTNGLFGNARGSGHVYLADGYNIYNDGTQLIHVNMGAGPSYNGYFLEKLVAPHFTDSAPEEVVYPHHWTFYCIYKD